MNFLEHIKDKRVEILLNMLGLLFLSLFLGFTGSEIHIITIIDGVWGMVLIIYLLCGYIVKKKRHEELRITAKNLDKRFLMGEVLDEPKSSEGQLYHELMRMACKSMIEEINSVKRDRLQYKEYIEQWVHEIKLPIAALKLIGENNKSSVTRKMLSEVESLEGYVEQVLYYARSENVAKDFFVRGINLGEVVGEVLTQNKYLLMKSGIEIELMELQEEVFSDEKWLGFILNQIITNAVKYSDEVDAKLEIRCFKEAKGYVLSIKDNGIGIKEEELSRVFEKGFTGTTGREKVKATGLGLYLVKKLCDKLGHEIEIESKFNKGTEVKIFFAAIASNVTKMRG